MTDVGIQHHGVLFTFEVKYPAEPGKVNQKQGVFVKETLILDEGEALRFYGTIAMEELDVAGRNLFQLDPGFRGQVLFSARIREREQART